MSRSTLYITRLLPAPVMAALRERYTLVSQPVENQIPTGDDQRRGLKEEMRSLLALVHPDFLVERTEDLEERSRTDGVPTAYRSLAGVPRATPQSELLPDRRPRDNHRCEIGRSPIQIV